MSNVFLPDSMVRVKKSWWDDAFIEKSLGNAGLRVAEYDDPKMGVWIECQLCDSPILCLNRQWKSSDGLRAEMKLKALRDEAQDAGPIVVWEICTGG